MSHRALGQQFVSHVELAGMYSGDHDVEMRHTHAALREEWESRRGDIKFSGDNPDDPKTMVEYGIHDKDAEHGGPDRYIAHLKADIAKNGIREPLHVRGGNVVTDGHHRAVAAMQLKLNRIPVEHRR